ncbi:DNA/RNA polymerases superfamily protein [Gossypium australe]|uniref:DNA/RNA polymerases superfamily protein n=1 Tax=Gossypium australe TaxID=47621 RepID=A0A5B6W7X8_9ROSI|nr:DNA/RNA polymerases superfamily protein [Gossypium australe]
MLRCCVIEFEGSWERLLPLTEFSYNNSYQSSINMALYEVLYDHVASDIQKYYAYLKKKKDIEFEIGDKVFLKVWKNVLRFGRKRKRIGLVAYQLPLPPEWDKIHNVFHVSILIRYRFDPSYVLTPYEIELQPNLTYSENPIKILVWEVKELRNKRMASSQHKRGYLGAGRNHEISILSSFVN